MAVLVRHSGGILLFDTGCRPDAMAGGWPANMREAFPLARTSEQALTHQLSLCGISASQVDTCLLYTSFCFLDLCFMQALWAFRTVRDFPACPRHISAETCSACPACLSAGLSSRMPARAATPVTAPTYNAMNAIHAVPLCLSKVSPAGFSSPAQSFIFSEGHA